jgi:hypothetical protein
MRGRRAATGLVGALAIGAPFLLAACGTTGSKSSGSGHGAACAFVAKLDDITAGVARADVHDPDEFEKTLDTAVHDYVTNVRSLRAVAPTELRAGLERMESDVQQYRFEAALTDRAGLDAYAARNCGRAPLGATSTTGPGSTGSLPDTSSTVPAPSTTLAGDPTSAGVSSGTSSGG